ncbi:uncharacterized protein PAC_00245 [Phialocephala subalpina]|uniref:Uncharacterized protein n=1 Tax=Phialocephala subalpina TaxID=576137 RepID=A0A1L7WC60_9HELO|nr:uncharacterized protein PAC_00245 [Phialocephala subalpina]
MSRFNPIYEAVELVEDPFRDPIQSTPSLRTSQTKEPLGNDASEYLPAKAFAPARKTKFKRVCFRIFIGIAALILWIAMMFVLYMFHTSDSQTCQDDSIFALDETAGNFTIGQSRVIDISFNLIAGRGLQATLGFVSYRVVIDILMRIMELTPVSFELFSALTFQPSAVLTVWPILKSLFQLSGLRPRFVMAWVLFSVLFLIALPTLMDTMTRYVQNGETFYKLTDGSTIQYNLYNSSTSPFNITDTTCRPLQNGGYQWGFSNLWFIVNWSVLGFWILGTYSVWMDAQGKCELRRKGRTMNSYRAVADMAEAMTEILGLNLAPYSGTELEKALRKRKGRVMYYADVDEGRGLGKVGLSSRRRGKMGKLRWDVVYGEERD